MIHVKKIAGRAALQMRAVRMGEDYTVMISGGEREHIGAVALGIPRPDGDAGNPESAMVAVLAVPGHREDELARTAAEKFASALNVTVCVSCGIHLDQAQPHEIADIVRTVLAMTDNMIQQLT